MSCGSVKDLRAFQGNDLYKDRVLHYNALLSHCHARVGLTPAAAYMAFTP